jgi:hypothetical protein
MSHATSNSIKIFPYGNKRASDPYKRVLNEQNISAIVSYINDFDSYVLSYVNNTMSFVLHGYYVQVDNIQSMITSGEPLYAKISLLNSGTSNAPVYCLSGADTNGKFTGVDFVTEVTTQDISLQLLDSSGNVPEKCWCRSKVKSIDFDETLILYCGDAQD